jgi:hypothetical protein
MRASVTMLNFNLPTALAQTSNDISIAFRPPLDGSISLSDELEIDLEQLDTEQDVPNLTSGQKLRLKIEAQNVHDLRVHGEHHGSSRFPSLARRRGG